MDLFDRIHPDFVFYQAGVDILGTDKLGKLNLSPATCARRDELVLGLCHQQHIPVQISMGAVILRRSKILSMHIVKHLK
ncbi:hypothetical protein [Sphingobacterium sp. E70]|uniref:hypothetical protein n=1 Tax=Sphingobacterium sp. E70 TaxID=2853439 RepID=UPI0027956BA3|nr:hypothetical protein [Sphingobacterium sp. E70]